MVQIDNDSKGEEVPREKSSGKVLVSRIAFLGLAWIFTICIIIQVFIAGMAVFESPLNWEKHTTFVHFIEFVPVLMFILGFLGRLPRMMTWGSFGLFALIFIQYATAHGIAPALHPVIALLLFGGSIVIARRSTKMVFTK